MVYELKIRLFHEGCPFINLSNQLQDLQFSTHCNDDFDLIMIPGKITPKIFAEIDTTFNLTNYQIVQGENNQSSYILMHCYYQRSERDHLPTTLIGKHNGLRIGPIGFYNGKATFSFICFNKSDIKAILGAYSDHNFDFELVSNTEMSTTNFINKLDTQGIPVSEFLNSITENQLKILTLAHSTGYYKIPREVKLADIAKELGVTRHAVEKTLRRAENKIMNIITPILNYEFSSNIDTLPHWFDQIHEVKSSLYSIKNTPILSL